MQFRAIIIDDEELARKRLRKMLQKYEPPLMIIGEALNGKEAVTCIDSLKPDVIFLDVQMPGLNGFEVVQQLRHKPLIIFTTAYDEYAMKAFEENSVDYLLKPIEQKRLDKAIEKLQRLFDAPKLSFNENVEKLLSQLASASLQRLQVKSGNKIFFIETNDIVYFEAKNKYTFLHTVEHEHIVELTLNELEERLDKQNFIRIHRSFIVNIRYILELVKWFAGKYKVRLKDKQKTELVVSRGYIDRVREL